MSQAPRSRRTDLGRRDGRPVDAAAAWPHRHLLDTDVLTWPQIELVLDTARHMAEIVAGERPRSTALRGVGVTNLFYEASTRTRVSFEVAAKQLSADVVNVVRERLVDREGRIAARHDAHARGPRRAGARHPPRDLGGAVPRRARVPRLGRQRRRRPACPSDPGAPRPRDAPPPRARRVAARAQGRDPRRRPPLAGRAQQPVDAHAPRAPTSGCAARRHCCADSRRGPPRASAASAGSRSRRTSRRRSCATPRP